MHNSMEDNLTSSLSKSQSYQNSICGDQAKETFFQIVNFCKCTTKLSKGFVSFSSENEVLFWHRLTQVVPEKGP